MLKFLSGRDSVRNVRSDQDRFPITADAERKIDRRRFLSAAGAAAAVTIGGEWIARVAAAARPSQLEVELDAMRTLAVGDAHAAITADGAETLIVRLDASSVVGFARRCPHLGCPVMWAAARGRFECPCHHAAFDARTGRVLFGPPRRGLEPVVIRTA
jgi:nitrite reductase/ring-hydroxylating ferredoxin subunit